MLQAQVDRKLVAHLLPRSPGAEAYRVLRTNLQFLAMDRAMRSLLVTSAGPSEGKTLTSANLAVTFAQAGQRVLVVDADLRRPLLADVFGLPARRVGLTSVLVGGLTLDQVVQAGPESSLFILPSGPIPPNPAELLGSERMGMLLQQLTDRYDLVILDTPPVLAVTDPCVLAPKVDGVVLTLRAGKVGHPQARRAVDALRAVKAPILGAVLGGIERHGSDGYDYYYYYHHYYGRP